MSMVKTLFVLTLIIFMSSAHAEQKDTPFSHVTFGGHSIMKMNPKPEPRCAFHQIWALLMIKDGLLAGVKSCEKQTTDGRSFKNKPASEICIDFVVRTEGRHIAKMMMTDLKKEKCDSGVEITAKGG